MEKYNQDEVYNASLEYFDGDDLAANVFVSKYALRNDEGNFLEKTPTDTHRRLAREFARVQKVKYENNDTISPLSEDEIFSYFDKFKYIIPQGSVMFGVGNNYQLTSSANCFVLSTPDDSYGSIMKTDEELVQLSKRRGGVGIDMKNIRPTGAKTNNASQTSTGIIPFMDRFSNSIREVGQEGRRGALMITFPIDHFSIYEFINAKKDLTKVTGANISVRISNKFMEAVQSDSEFEICFPVDYKEKNIKPTHSKMIKARHLWNEIVKTAHTSAEPGVLFWDNMLDYSPANSYDEFRSESTNPCVVGETLVLTNIGWIQIQNLDKNKEKYNDLKIITRNDENKLHESELEKVWITNPESEIYRVYYVNEQIGLEEYLDVSPDHKFYTKYFEERIITKIEKGEKLISGFNEITVLKVKKLSTNKEVWDLTANPNYNFYSVLNRDELIINKTECNVEGKDYYFYSILEDEGKTFFAYEYNDQPVNNQVIDYFNNSILSVDCAEISMSAGESCRLITTNLYSYVDNPFTEKSKFNYEKFYDHIKVGQRLIDDLVDLDIEMIDKILDKIGTDPESIDDKYREIKTWQMIKDKAIRGRRTGLGITSLADCLAAMGVNYNSNEAVDTVGDIMRTLRDASYESSVEMAEAIGAFPEFDAELEKDNKFNQRIKKTNPALYERMMKFGRRNIAINTLSPNGSMSLLTQKSSGIEPVFMLSYDRRRKLDSNSTETPDFVDNLGDRWQTFTVFHQTVKKWMDITGNNNLEESPWNGNTAPEIEWKKRVQIQSIAQHYIDHSISSCITQDMLIETNVGLMYFDELVDVELLEDNHFVKNTTTDIKVRNKYDKFVPIDLFYKNGMKKINKIVLNNGAELLSTANERVIVYDAATADEDWKKVEDLRLNDLIKIATGV